MNAYHVKKERDFFGGLKLVDKSRAIYGYIASPMRLKDLPDDIRKKEVFEDKKSDALVSLYTYIRNHLARDFNGEFENRLKSNNGSYLWVGLLFLSGVLFFGLNNHDDGLVEIVKKEIEKKEEVIKEQKEEIKEVKKENNKDKMIIFTQAKKLEIVNQAINELEKEYPDIAHKLKKKLDFEGVEIAYNYFMSIDLNNYQKIDVVEKVDSREVILKPLKNIELENNISDIEEVIISKDFYRQDSFPSIIKYSNITSFKLNNSSSLKSGELLSGLIEFTNWSYMSIKYELCMYLYIKEKKIKSDKVCRSYNIPEFRVNTYEFRDIPSLEVNKKTKILFIIEDRNQTIMVEKIVISPY
jgi:hypothetical protein